MKIYHGAEPVDAIIHGEKEHINLPKLEEDTWNYELVDLVRLTLSAHSPEL